MIVIYIIGFIHIDIDTTMTNHRRNRKTKDNKDVEDVVDIVKYNTKSLSIKKSSTLIIADWDDTLYPTSWITENNVDLTNPKSRYKYIKYFDCLDVYLSALLDYMMTLGEVMIITNAMLEWIELSVSILPKTKKSIEKIDVVSARQKYGNQTTMANWKKHTFFDEVSRKLSSRKQRYNNIISMGDAEFEHNALVNLYNKEILPHKYLKSIKFIKSSNYNTLLEQIKMIKQNISQICHMQRQIDLTFDHP